jgi:hypothetical protein
MRLNEPISPIKSPYSLHAVFSSPPGLQTLDFVRKFARMMANVFAGFRGEPFGPVELAEESPDF